MAIFILLVSFLSFNILFTTPVSATYPTPDIAHWDLSISDERNDADYKEVQSLVEQKYLDAALALLNKKIEELPKEASPIILKAFVLHEKGLAKELLKLVKKKTKKKLVFQKPISPLGSKLLKSLNKIL